MASYNSSSIVRSANAGDLTRFEQAGFRLLGKLAGSFSKLA